MTVIVVILAVFFKFYHSADAVLYCVEELFSHMLVLLLLALFGSQLITFIIFHFSLFMFFFLFMDPYFVKTEYDLC